MLIGSSSKDGCTHGPSYPLCADAVSFEGILGKHRYVVVHEGGVVKSTGPAINQLTTSVILGGSQSGGRAESDITIEINPFAGQIQIFVPMTSVTGLYWHKSLGGLYLSTDPRLLLRPQMQLDQRGLYSLFQFGALIPTLTPWREIARLMPGSVYTIVDDDLKISQRIWLTSKPVTSDTDKSLPLDRQCEVVAAELDRTLQRLCPDRRPIILFSGGVDSGLLAARAAAMGWQQTLLVNFQMGSEDPESVHAEAMARSLGLSFERIHYRPDQIERFLSCLGATYPLPFGDFSAFPTWLLAEAVVERHKSHRVVLNGMGAEGAFGLFGEYEWRTPYARLPKFIRMLSAVMYKKFGLWIRESRLARMRGLLLLMTYFHEMPVLHASVAVNPLCGISYHVPEEARSETHELLDRWLETCVPWTDNQRLLNVLFLVLVQCGIFAQKDKAIFDASPLDVRHPFLEPNMVQLGLERAIYWPAAKEGKTPLKNLLAQHVPREMVFRPKSGFDPPVKKLLESQAFLQGVERLLQPTSPLSPMLDHRCIRRLHGRLQRGQSLPVEIYGFLWLAVTVNLWLNQVCESRQELTCPQ